MSVQRPPSSAENEERIKGFIEQIEFLRQRVRVLEKSGSERCQADREVHMACITATLGVIALGLGFER